MRPTVCISLCTHTAEPCLDGWLEQLKSSRPKQNKPCSSNQIQQRFSKHLVYARHIIAKPQCRHYHSPESSRCIFKQIFITKVSTVANSLHSPTNADIHWINQWLTVQDLLRILSSLRSCLNQENNYLLCLNAFLSQNFAKSCQWSPVFASSSHGNEIVSGNLCISTEESKILQE